MGVSEGNLAPIGQREPRVFSAKSGEDAEKIDEQHLRLLRMTTQGAPEDNELAKNVLHRLKHFSLGNAFSVRVAVAGVLTTGANATSIILPSSSDYYESGTFLERV